MMHIPVDISAAASWLWIAGFGLIAWFLRREVAKGDAWRHRIEAEIDNLNNDSQPTLFLKELHRNERTSDKAHERLDQLTERLTILETRVAYIVDRPDT